MINDLKIYNHVVPLQIGETTVGVLQYLPVEDKYDLINLALQNSLENGMYNRVKMNMYFRLYIMYMYTDLEFTDEEKEFENRLFDILESNGVIEAVLNAMDKDELRTLNDWLFDTMEDRQKYNNTIASVIHSFIDDLPKNAEDAKNIIEKFNPESFQAVLDFAKAANGNRPIE